jgi:hypothetical protein
MTRHHFICAAVSQPWQVGHYRHISSADEFLFPQKNKLHTAPDESSLANWSVNAGALKYISRLVGRDRNERAKTAMNISL